MILKFLYVYLNPEEFRDDLGVQFGFRTRYLCNYIERNLKLIKFKSDGFGKICIMGTLKSKFECSIVPENALRVSVPFNTSEYLNLPPDDWHEFYIKLLTDGLNQIDLKYSIPKSEIFDSISSFRIGSNVNEWVFVSKKTKDRKITALLVCSLDQYKFILRLILKRDQLVIFEKQILETKPDEIIFAYRFKNMFINNDELVVADKFGDSLYRMNIKDL